MRLDRKRLVGISLLCAAVAVAAAADPTSPVPPPAPPDTPLQSAPGPEPSPAAAEMLKSMREKGMLTEDEYQELYRRQAKYEAEHEQKNSLPGWLQDWTFGGDLRLQYDNRDFGGLGSGPYVPGQQNVNVVTNPNYALGRESRFRIRLRLGAEKRVNEQFTFGVRLATSATANNLDPVTTEGAFFDAVHGTTVATPLLSDPRRPDIALGDFFSYKSVFLDRMYVRYQPDFAPTFSAIAGKFGNPFISRYFSLDRIVWDPDIQPEGVAAQYRFDFVPEKLWLEAVGAGLLVQQTSTVTVQYDSNFNDATPILPQFDQQNPYLLGFQGGLHGRPTPWLQMGFRTSYYDLSHIGTQLAAAMEDQGNGGAAIDHNPLFQILGPSSPLFENGKSKGRMHELVVDAYARLTPWGERYAITPFFQYMTLLNATSEDQGWVAGVDLGSVQFLRVSLMYAYIERNATMALFTDSDAYEGFTNAKGWYVAAEREIFRGVRVRGVYMFSQQANDTCHDASKNLALCDTASQLSLLDDFRRTTLDRNRWQLDFIVDF